MSLHTGVEGGGGEEVIHGIEFASVKERQVISNDTNTANCFC